MKLLFIHQGFPGQYVHIVEELTRDQNNSIIALGLSDYKSNKKNLTYIKYGLNRTNAEGLHPWLLDLESKVIRGEACAKIAEQLRFKGFIPDIICGHPGWGELLFINDIWPEVPILHYQEFYYNEENSDSDFDPEFRSKIVWQDKARTLLKTVNPQINLEKSTWSVTPTNFQKSTFPVEKQKRISVIHDGIDIDRSKPGKKTKTLSLPNGDKITSDSPLITFVNRSLEPYRGCHTFIRSIPKLQKKIEGCKILIIGATKGVSYGAKCPEGGEWTDKFFREIEGKYNPSDVYLLGTIDHESFTSIIQRSNVHIYLTYPFVLSWSLLEAMACATPIIGSKTKPVMELIEHKKNGLLVDFFDTDAISDSAESLIRDKKLATCLGNNARQTIKDKYELKKCVANQIKLINMVAEKILE